MMQQLGHKEPTIERRAHRVRVCRWLEVPAFWYLSFAFELLRPPDSWFYHNRRSGLLLSVGRTLSRFKTSHPMRFLLPHASSSIHSRSRFAQVTQTGHLVTSRGSHHMGRMGVKSEYGMELQICAYKTQRPLVEVRS